MSYEYDQCLKHRKTSRITEEIFIQIYPERTDLHPYLCWQLALEKAAAERSGSRGYVLTQIQSGRAASEADHALLKRMAAHELRSWELR